MKMCQAIALIFTIYNMIQPTNHPIREEEKMKEHKQKKRMLRSFWLLWERGKNNGWKQLRKGNQASWQLRLPHLGHWKHPTSLVVCSFHNHVYTRCHPGLKPFITKPNQFYFVYSEFSFVTLFPMLIWPWQRFRGFHTCLPG